MIIRLANVCRVLNLELLVKNRSFTEENAEGKQDLGLNPGSSGFSAISAISAINKLVAFTAIGENRGCNFS